MPVPFANSAGLIAAAAVTAAAPGSLRFDQAFRVAGAAHDSRATVLYHGRDGIHRLVLTRQGERRVRRDTDARLTSVAVHRAGDAGYRLDLFDRARRIHTVVNRDSLYRVGRFTDWFDLAHGLRQPVGAYRLAALAAAPAAPAPLRPCRWFALDQPQGRATICWSAAEGLPMLILDARGRPVWRVATIDHKPVAASSFAPDSTGYVLADAAEDISGD